MSNDSSPNGKIIRDFRVGFFRGSLRVGYSGTRIVVGKRGLLGQESFIVPDDAAVQTHNGRWN